ncbi:hypothetical protein [Flavobacterium franklandianum]|uniref:hypothetical protein n=1 Tax=Flavobacterium franklandianum TaxID=2594430 RepID=UPI0029391B4A|nr:hypothetical protein [Flavobacterium franklandianum]
MGRNLLLNMADQKHAVAGLDLDTKKMLSLTQEANPRILHNYRGLRHGKKPLILILRF